MITVVGVPIDCVGVPEAGDPPFGTELSPGALRAAGMVAAIGGRDGGDLPVRLVGRDRDARTGILAWPSVQTMTDVVRRHVRQLLTAGHRPLVLGGCCTLLPAVLAGARDALGGTGLAYLDGHLDLYDGRTSPTGEPADMPISVVTGHGPVDWVDLVGGPLVNPDRLRLLGPRDRAEAIEYGSVLPEQLGYRPELTPGDLREQGMAGAGAAARDALAEGGSYWVHLDVDVLDQQAFPATDYLMPGGLGLPELRELMRPLTGSDALAGVSVGCYNPDKDPDGASAAALVDLFADVLRA
ncbi:arginase family protein [Catellatospora methionotrophica]|uniref:arginase family protein n=1 Tax=Catellatospora methionotrophica TaxID=121620 RepID=UPI0033FD7290